MKKKWVARYVPLVNPDLITHRLIRNPNYGGVGTAVPGTCAVPYRNKGVKPRTRALIKRDIAANGVRNPILLYNDPGLGLLLGFGGGRVFACQELGLTLPAIVNDWAGEFTKCEEVTTENYRQFFTDVPAFFEETPIGLDYHYNLECAREGDIDPAGVAWCDAAEMAVVREESPWLENRGG